MKGMILLYHATLTLPFIQRPVPRVSWVADLFCPDLIFQTTIELAPFASDDILINPGKLTISALAQDTQMARFSRWQS
jgi:hypothetical protein